KVEEELRLLRIERLGAEQAGIEHLVAKASAEGATLGQIKRAYGTKDHRTISNIVTTRAAEIEALRKSMRENKRAEKQWFQLDTADRVLVTVGRDSAYYDDTEIDGEFMFSTDVPLWNEDYTIKNEAVALLDGKTESESDEAAEIGRAIRSL